MNDDIYTIDQISALMYVRHISLRKMSKLLGIASTRMHAMLKYKDEEHNKLLRIACTWVLQHLEMEMLPPPAPYAEGLFRLPTTITLKDVSKNEPMEVTL